MLSKIRLDVFYSQPDLNYPIKKKIMFNPADFKCILKNSKITQGQAEIIKSEGRKDHDILNEMKDQHGTHNTILNLLT